MKQGNETSKWCVVIGVEGAGHHLILSVLHDWAHGGFADKSLSVRWDRGPFMHDGWGDVLESVKGQKYIYTTSAPYDNPRDSLRRPDYVDMVHNIPDAVFFVLKRNPVKCVASAIRRGFAPDVFEQTKIVEDNMIYISHQVKYLQDVARASVHFIDFEAAIDKPHEACNIIASALGDENIRSRVNLISRWQYKGRELTPEELEWVTQEFDRFLKVKF